MKKCLPIIMTVALCSTQMLQQQGNQPQPSGQPQGSWPLPNPLHALQQVGAAAAGGISRIPGMDGIIADAKTLEQRARDGMLLGHKANEATNRIQGLIQQAQSLLPQVQAIGPEIQGLMNEMHKILADVEAIAKKYGAFGNSNH